MIQNRLALEKAKIDEEYSQGNEDKDSEDFNDERKSEEQLSHSKVNKWMKSNRSYYENEKNPKSVVNDDKLMQINMEMFSARTCVVDGLEKLYKLKIPRCHMKYPEEYTLEQHVFCDASQQALATASVEE
ncbi:hypothetical protein JTB14_036738 [Gonioctena quinquepunctata]|nr:hypothetical protein JTB14_036738 [Gonioctena quinquepunctata]